MSFRDFGKLESLKVGGTLKEGSIVILRKRNENPRRNILATKDVKNSFFLSSVLCKI
jgi:hypothetical protein